MTSLFQRSACEVIEQLRSGELTVTDALNCLHDRIEAVDSTINALPTVCLDRAFDQAKKIEATPVEQRGPLCGLPVTIKDLMAVEGVRTTFGSRVLEHNVPEQSDQLVQRIEQRGGVIYAKSNTPEFGAGGITFNDVFGITRTPINTRYTSGGSSGGAAASLASGCAWLSHGSDMAGSLRTPAAFCGVTSLRPSPGTIRSDSLYLPFEVLGAQGPMARDIKDLALFADVLRNCDGDAMQQAADLPAKPGRVAISCDLGITDIGDDVRAEFKALIDRLSDLGWAITEAHPDLTDVHSSFDALRAQSFAVHLEEALANNPGVMKPELVWNIEQGLALDSSQIREALRAQGQIVDRAARFMQDVDLLICPATSLSAVPAESRYPGADTGVPIVEYYRWLAIAYATTMTTLPIITLPGGECANGMPLGIQLIGKPYGDASLFSYAQMVEQVVGRSSLPIDPAGDPSPNQ